MLRRRMIEDFTIKDGIYLVSGEDTLDLHNNYDFTEIKYSVAERRATLTWLRAFHFQSGAIVAIAADEAKAIIRRG